MGSEEEKTTFLSIYSTALVAVLCYVFLSFLWKRMSTSAPLPPGPAGLPLVGSLPFLDPQLHTYFASLAKTYGPILSIKLGSKLGVVITSSSLAREVVREHDAIFANRPILAVSNGIVGSPNGLTWRMLRKVCVRELFGGATLDAMYGLRRKEVRAMVRRMRGRAGEPVDVGAEMFLTVMNVLTNMLWSGRIREGNDDDTVGEEFKVLVEGTLELLSAPNASDHFPLLRKFGLLGEEKKLHAFLKKFDRIFDKIISQRIDDNGGDVGEGDKDLLDVLLRMEKEGGDGKTPITRTHLRSLFVDMMIAGTDTTSNTTEFVMAEMMREPSTMKKAQEELDAVIGRDAVVEESHIHKLPYLGAVIKETLRLHPTVPLLLPHCPSQSTLVGGYTVPKGSMVFINVWAIHRDPSVWEDPLVFRPERFLQGVVDGMVSDFSGNNLAYFPFGSGRRMCVGVGMAERIVTYTVASLLHSFNWRMPKGEELDLVEKFGGVLKKAPPLVAVPTPRLSRQELYA